jgi:DNA-binding SARP family transcriptional activator
VQQFHILGPLEVAGEDGPLRLGGAKQRALLALLALNAGRVIPTDTLVDQLWGEHPPRTAVTSLQNFVSQLRKLLGPETLMTRAPGYVLHVDPNQVDTFRFERLLAEARGAPPAEREARLREALALWRGPPLADFAFEAFAQGDIRRLEELRAVALEERIAADLELGRHGELVSELEALVAQHPLRERLRGQLMLALYRSGRQAEALQGYHDARGVLVEELGIEPGRPLQELFSSILRQDAALELGADERGVATDDHLQEIAKAIAVGRLVVVLGPGVNACSSVEANGASLPLQTEITARLAEAFGCPPEHSGELTKVAQYVSVTRGVGPLYDELHALFTQEHAPGPVHHFLAELPARLRARGAPQPLLVTTSYDRALEQAFAEAGEALEVVTYVSLGRDRGRFLHRSADGRVRMIITPNAYADVPFDGHPVLLKIHGEVDIDPGRDAESFVVSEDDYIAYLSESGLGGVLPVTVAARLRRSHYLFLGYGLVDWSFRVFLQRLWPDEQPAYRSWAVQADASALEQEFWRRRAVDLIDSPLGEEVEQLRARLRIELGSPSSEGE